MPTKSYAQFHVNENTRIANEAHRLMMLAGREGRSLDLYVWYSPMKLWVAEEKPADNAQLAFPERVPTHLTVEQVNAWVAARTGRVPYLNEG